MAGGQDPKWQKDAADQNFDYMFKLLIIGNSSVGKTSFLFRYADDSFTSAFVSTVGIDFKVKTVFRHDKRVKLQIWVSINNCRSNPPIKGIHGSHRSRTLPVRKGTGLSRQPTTEEPWALFSCMTLQTKNPLIVYKIGKHR